ncbi:FAD-dependent oxidoreductase [Bacillus testis]|uniref:FAD-dependent oxidoreductase n=1 Tax=Bacillus testis TaxID=1622072 RepID=UPI00067EF6A2|nr:FAD-dependent oxidoreductase [Bacillus testis]
MNKRIAVIGGGIGGLGVALALQKLGYSVTLYEKQEKTIELGAGIILGANAMVALDFLQLGDAIREIGWTEKFCSILTEKGKQLTKLHL